MDGLANSPKEHRSLGHRQADADPFDQDHLEAAFAVFIRYGFKKTNMDDVASALGLSRQAVYKRYGNKQVLFASLVDAMMAQRFRAARAELARADIAPIQRFVNSIDQLAGRFVELLRSSPHSVEVIAMVNLEKQSLVENYEAAFHQARCTLLIEHHLVSDAQQADNVVHAFTYAAKGLLHTAENYDSFKHGIYQTVRALLPLAAGDLDGV